MTITWVWGFAGDVNSFPTVGFGGEERGTPHSCLSPRPVSELIPLLSCSHLSLFLGFPQLLDSGATRGPFINSRSPAVQQTSSRTFRIWFALVKQGAFWVQRQRQSAGTSGIHGHGRQLLHAMKLVDTGSGNVDSLKLPWRIAPKFILIAFPEV